MSKIVSCASFAALLSVAFGGATTARAQCPEIGPIQTYTNQPGGTYAVCNCFVPGEEAGQYFPTSMIPASDYPIQITKIAIGWYSQQGGQGATVEDAILVYGNGTFPNPGGLIATLSAPQLTDGALNEFDVTQQNIQINSPAFYVTLRFYNTTDASVVSPPYPPSMTSDDPVNGYVAGRNVVKATSPFSGWYSANGSFPSGLGVSGDWLMHVKYRKVNGCGGGGFTGTPYCFGDGSGSVLCPCDPGQSGGTGEGCAHSFGFGGMLGATGLASVANDSVVLHATNLPPTTASLCFQGTTKTNGGNGSQFGDGLLCVSGSIIRLGTRTTSGGASDFGFGIGADQPISVHGAIPAVGATRRYQIWFRNAASFCTNSTFNLSNGLEVVWTP